jgi:hypothetical protein
VLFYLSARLNVPSTPGIQRGGRERREINLFAHKIKNTLFFLCARGGKEMSFVYDLRYNAYRNQVRKQGNRKITRR